MEPKRYSICCTAPPLGELCESQGRCSKCKEGTMFYTEQELEELDNADMQNRKITLRFGP
jgi:hypothetical protein